MFWQWNWEGSVQLFKMHNLTMTLTSHRVFARCVWRCEGKQGLSVSLNLSFFSHCTCEFLSVQSSTTYESLLRATVQTCSPLFIHITVHIYFSANTNTVQPTAFEAQRPFLSLCPCVCFLFRVCKHETWIHTPLRCMTNMSSAVPHCLKPAAQTCTYGKHPILKVIDRTKIELNVRNLPWKTGC